MTWFVLPDWNSHANSLAPYSSSMQIFPTYRKIHRVTFRCNEIPVPWRIMPIVLLCGLPWVRPLLKLSLCTIVFIPIWDVISLLTRCPNHVNLSWSFSCSIDLFMYCIVRYVACLYRLNQGWLLDTAFQTLVTCFHQRILVAIFQK